jgi:hypothetical protein
VISGIYLCVKMPSLFVDVTQRRIVVTDVSGQPITPTFRKQSVQKNQNYSRTEEKETNKMPLIILFAGVFFGDANDR